MVATSAQQRSVAQPGTALAISNRELVVVGSVYIRSAIKSLGTGSSSRVDFLLTRNS